MSSAANLKSKGGKAPANANNDEDSIMPLLFATIGNPSISFKKMAAMDELGRSESSLEHKFRKWRQKGREIAAKNPAHAGSPNTSNVGGITTKKPSAAAKKGTNGNGKGSIKHAGVDAKETEDDDGEGTNKMGGMGGDKSPSPSNGKATATNSTKKRAASLQVDNTEQKDDISHKKAKVVKKGTARVVKKPKAKVESSSEEEDADYGDEEKVPTKPMGERKADITAAQPTGTETAKQVKAARAASAANAANARQIWIPGNDKAGVDINAEGSHHVDMVDMQFDLAA